MRGPKILILTVDHGAGHQRLASALRKAFIGIQPQLSVEVVNALKLCARWFRVYYDSYEVPLKYWPALWGWIEQFQHAGTSTGPAWLYRRGGRPLTRFIQEFHPDIVVATEVGLCELAALAKRETEQVFYLVGVPPGADVDRAWAQPEVDLYLVAARDAAAQLGAVGVSCAKILPSGVPIDPTFGTVLDRAGVRVRLGVKGDFPLILILFGGTGFGKPKRILQELKKVRAPFQAVFITGRNRLLQQELQRQAQVYPHFRVLGWVANMDEWMAVADLLVSKPGACTVAEAVNSGLPLLAFDPLPGEERRTCDLIEKWQVGHRVRRPSDLALALSELLASNEELQRLRANALKLARPRAAYEGAQAILRLWRLSAYATTRFAAQEVRLGKLSC